MSKLWNVIQWKRTGNHGENTRVESTLAMFVNLIGNSFKWPDMALHVGRKVFQACRKDVKQQTSFVNTST